MKTFLAIMVVALLGLAGCRTQPDYGTYNIGLCSPNHRMFMESFVDVEPGTFTVVANALGPTLAEKLDKPLVFKYVGDVGNFRKYTVQINNHEDQVLVRVENGQFEGYFNVAGHLEATLHGHKGTLENTGLDGVSESKSCLGE